MTGRSFRVVRCVSLVALAMTGSVRANGAVPGSLRDFPRSVPGSVSPDAAVADFNMDGRPDLFVLNTDTPNLGACQPSQSLTCDANTRVRIFLGDGGTGFTDGPVVMTGCNPARIVTGDFDDDGVLDIVTMNRGYSGSSGICIRPSLSLLRGDGAGGFQTRRDFAVPEGLTDIAAGDVIFDAVPEVAALLESVDLAVYRFDTDGNMSGGAVRHLPSRGTRLALGDLDGDGFQDAAATLPTPSSPGTSYVGLLRGDGLGGFTIQQTCPLDSLTISSEGIVLADLDGNAWPEIVVASRAYPGPTSGLLERFKRDGAGSWCGTEPRLTRQVADEWVWSVASADFDGDGRPDLVTSGEPRVTGAMPVLRVFPNDGSGWIQTSVTYFMFEAEQRLAIGDFDGNLMPDVAAVGQRSVYHSLRFAHVYFNGTDPGILVNLRVETGPFRVAWADAGADSYDVVWGDIPTLSQWKGNHYDAISGCLANDLPALEVGAPGTPPPGGAHFYLVRGRSASGPGTYDEGSASQAGSRDAMIAWAPGRCP